MSLQIHWHEGLFLQPHHLQQFQKNVFDLVAGERLRAWNYPYGVVESALSPDELHNNRIRFDKLRVIMPSGLEVDFPHNAELPTIDIKRAFQTNPSGFTVLLAVPLWQPQRANTLDAPSAADPRAKLIYAVPKPNPKYCDENTGMDPKEVSVRRINARLVLGTEDLANLEVMPLLRIVRSANEDSTTPRLDPAFVAPSLVIGASRVLTNLVRDISEQVAARRTELVIQVARGGFSIDTMRGQQFEQIMRLRTLNRYAARLPSLVTAPSVPPFTWYLELRGMLAELVALYPDRDDFDVADYNHDNPVLCIAELSRKLRDYLRGVVTSSFVKVPFRLENNVLMATFEPEHFTAPSDYLLGIKTKQDPIELAHFVTNPDVFKLLATSAMRPDGSVRAHFGIPLQEERQQPLELPGQADLRYFRLQRGGKNKALWDEIERKQGAIIHFTRGDLTDCEVALYLVIPAQSTK